MQSGSWSRMRGAIPLAASLFALLAPRIALARGEAAFRRLHGETRAAARPEAESGRLAWKGPVREGSTPRSEGTRFVVRSGNATRIDLELFGPYDEVIGDERKNLLGVPRRVIRMARQGDLWIADVAGVRPGEVYGLRAWGPNWPYSPDWKPGSEAGFVADVDGEGNRFAPNKLLIDPWARAITRDPDWTGETHATGPRRRRLDSAPYQGKAIVVDDRFDWGQDKKPARMLKDTVVYEVHLKGMTQRFPGLADAGTYAALADDRVLAYLKSLGVTAVELLPLHEAPNDVNDVDPSDTQGKNYWGYMTLAYFAPDRRYAKGQGFDAPVREFKTMVKKLHAAGIEVILDVVFNHTAEGGVWRDKTGASDLETATVFSWRGLDNAFYYELAGGNRSFYDNTGIGANLRTAHPGCQDYLMASMKYFVEEMRVDGFRFDLASVLGNRIDRDGFAFQKIGGFLDRIAKEFGYQGDDPYQNAKLPKLIAEPWAIFDDTYQVGNFPRGWAEWNGKFRDTARRFLKAEARAGEMMGRVNGSHELYGDDGRTAHHSVNFITAHDGLTLFDLVSYDVNGKAERDRLNLRAWPHGPSDGGEEHNNSWSSTVPGASREETSALRRQQARNAMALLMLSNGTPMLLGGDERLRTQEGNNNAYNLDNQTSWLEWGPAPDRLDDVPDRVNHLDRVPMPGAGIRAFREFSARLIRFRRAHPAFHKAGWWSPDRDADGDGYPGLVWRGPDGGAPDPAGMTFSYRLDAARGEVGMGEKEFGSYPLRDRDLLVLVNLGHQGVDYLLPTPSRGKAWHRVADTHAWAEVHGNFWDEAAQERVDGRYGVNPRSIVVLAER